MKSIRKFFAFLEKDLKIAMSYKFNLFLQLISAIFLLLIVYLSFGNQLLISSSEQNELAGFINIFIGIVLIDYMFSSLSVFSREVRLAQTLGTFESLLLTNTSIATIMFSSYALTFMRVNLRAILYFLLVKFLFGANISLASLPFYLFTIFYCSIPFIGLGLISASVIVIFKVGNIANFFISITSIFFSGIFFSLDALPSYLSNIGQNLSMNICLEIIKGLVFSDISIKEIIPKIVMVLFQILLILPMGLMLMSYAIKVSKKNGSLSYY